MRKKNLLKFEWYRAFPFCVAMLTILVVVPFLKLHGFENDASTFWAWMSKLNSQPLTQFYSKDYFADYFPLYLIVLKFLGFFAPIFGVTSLQDGGYVFLKIPSIIANFLFAFWLVRKWMGENKIESTAALFNANFIGIAFLALNPAILYNYAGFSQVDVIFVALGTLAIDAIVQKKLINFAYFFALLFAMKPQSLFLAPFFSLYLVTQYRFCRDWKVFLKAFGIFIVVVVALFALFWWQNPVGAIEHYQKGLSSYSYASVNAFNFFAVVNGNWVNVDSFRFLGMTVEMIYGISLLISFGFIALTLRKYRGSLNLRKLSSEQIIMLGAIFVLGMFLFFPKMHERYVLAVFPFIYFLANRSKQMFMAIVALSIATTLNESFVIDHFYGSKNEINGPIMYGCFWLYLYCYLVMHWEFEKSIRTDVAVSSINLNAESIDSHFKFSINRPALRREWLWVSVILAVSGISTFYHLGTTQMVATGAMIQESFQVKFNSPVEIKNIWIFSQGGEGKIFVKCENQSNESTIDVSYSWYYAWKESGLSGCNGPISIRAEIANGKPFGEFLFYDKNGKVAKPSEICFQSKGCVSPDSTKWFDETEQVAYKNNFQYGTYFDEVYYARAVEELLSGKYPWENTHPALSKFLMTWWVQLTAFEPFHWRFPNAVFGILIPLIVFMMTLRLLGNRFVAIAAGLLTSFEWSRIALSRIATIDIMVCFFMLLTYWFAFEILRDLNQSVLKKVKFKIPTLKLTLLALSLAGGLAIKWNSVFTYVAILGIFGIAWMVFHFRYPKVWKINFLDITKLFFFLMVVPFGLYWISFQPFHWYLKDGYDFQKFLQDQVNMYMYHSTLKATHSFSSVFWSWPFVHKPMWFYTDNGMVSGTYYSIAVMGNPAVWWSIFPVIAYMFYSGRMYRHPGLVMFFIGFCVQFFSWIIASRITFNYHFLPSAILATPILGAFLFELYQEKRKEFYVAVAAVVILTIMFFPLYTGEVVSREYVDKFLKWFPGWYF